MTFIEQTNLQSHTVSSVSNVAAKAAHGGKKSRPAIIKSILTSGERKRSLVHSTCEITKMEPEIPKKPLIKPNSGVLRGMSHEARDGRV